MSEKPKPLEEALSDFSEAFIEAIRPALEPIVEWLSRRLR